VDESQAILGRCTLCSLHLLVHYALFCKAVVLGIRVSCFATFLLGATISSSCIFTAGPFFM
jgi:hypothetical protein